MRRTILTISSLATFATLPLAAQEVRVVAPHAERYSYSWQSGGDRAMLGISTSSGSKRDTLGVLVASITTGGPADKAGLGEGDRLQSINGVSLKVNRDDAGDPEMSGIMQRRLSRELGKVKAGDEVTLQVWTNGQARTFKVKTVAADDLTQSRRKVVREADERAVIGLGYGLTGSKRDTAGVFVNSVAADGPAEKAGIVEGDRISAVNGVSLKLTKDDVEDGWFGNARLGRLSRELAKVKPGDAVELTVVSGGRAPRTIKVTTVKASSLKESGGSMNFIVRPFMGEGHGEMPMPPIPPMAPAVPRTPMLRWHSMEDGDFDVQLHLDDLRNELKGAQLEIQRSMREEMPRMQIEIQQQMQRAMKELQAAKLRLNVRSVSM